MARVKSQSQATVTTILLEPVTGPPRPQPLTREAAAAQPKGLKAFAKRPRKTSHNHSM